MDKRKQTRRVLAWVAAGVIVLALALLPLAAGSGTQEEERQASIRTAQVQTGSITTQIRGGGTLEASDTLEITIPSGVKITGFLVEDGQQVSQGEALAQVDPVTLLDAITQVQETMDYLQEQINSADDSGSESITAQVGGRVTAVYAQSGERVQEVMLRDGCLAVVSLDGLMAVDISGETDHRHPGGRGL